MEFAFTEEQQMIRDTAQSFLEGCSDSQAVRRAMATEKGYEDALWTRICEEMFWQGIAVDEDYGGMGLGAVELAATLEQMGRYLLCSPFFSTVCMGATAIALAGSSEQKSQFLPLIMEGKTATLAWTGESGRWNEDAIEATYKEVDGKIELNGMLRYVPDGHTAELLVVAARRDGSEGIDGIGLFIVPAETSGVRRDWLATMDQTRKQAEIRLDHVLIGRDFVLEEDCWPLLKKIVNLATIYAAAEQLGGAQQALDITIAYTQERVQFDRTIASYQAVKHKAADMMLKVEAARSAVYYAACVAQDVLEDGPLSEELAEAASIAKAYVSDAFFFVAGCGIQLHGGVGFTEEYDIQLYFKRAKSSETFLGNGDFHRACIADQLLGAC